MKTLFRFVFVLAALALVAAASLPAQQAPEYARSSRGTRVLEGAGGLAIKVLVEASNLGSSEVEIAEITFPAGSQGGGHVHGSHEIFYVLSGVLEHVVNDVPTLLEPGTVGIVRQGDTVAHRVPGDEPVKALVIWAPGGEAGRLASFFEERPVRP
jgi:quercetin dioxygenase-like cupin family protein